MLQCLTSHLQHLLNVKSLKYLSNLTLPDRITKSLLHLHKKKKPPSISAQFQVRHTRSQPHNAELNVRQAVLTTKITQLAYVGPKNLPPAVDMIKTRDPVQLAVGGHVSLLLHLHAAFTVHCLIPVFVHNVWEIYYVAHTSTQKS